MKHGRLTLITATAGWLAAAVPAYAGASLESRLFAGARQGPYALATKDRLNEMVIRSHLARFDVPLPETKLPSDKRRLLAAVPSHLPALGYLSSEFGLRRSPFSGRMRAHKGIDIGAVYGSPVYATADGVVTYAGWKGPLGQLVTINHGFHIVTRYGHNSRVLVKVGDQVRRGDVIAKVGNSGSSTGTHLHFEVRIAGNPVDPTRFMFDPADDLLGPTPGAALAWLPSGLGEGLLGGELRPQEGPTANTAQPDTFDEDEDSEPIMASVTPIPAIEQTLSDVNALSVRSPTEQQTAVAMPGGFDPKAFPAELRIGGDESLEHGPEIGRVPLLPYDRAAMFPINLTIILGFALLSALAVIGDLLPRLSGRRKDEHRAAPANL